MITSLKIKDSHHPSKVEISVDQEIITVKMEDPFKPGHYSTGTFGTDFFHHKYYLAENETMMGYFDGGGYHLVSDNNDQIEIFFTSVRILKGHKGYPVSVMIINKEICDNYVFEGSDVEAIITLSKATKEVY